MGGKFEHASKITSSLCLRMAAFTVACLLTLLLSPSKSTAVTYNYSTNALIDQTCAGYRAGGALGCTAGEFTVGASFSAAPGTPPFCVAGQYFNFLVDVRLFGSNANRYDIGFFVGQQGNAPDQTTALTTNCSVATFPETNLAPDTGTSWSDFDAGTQPTDTCGDYKAAGDTSNTINQVKVNCQGDVNGYLSIPYTLTYWQNAGNICTGAGDVTPGSTSKCNAGVSTVSGAVQVYSGAYVDVTKVTSPSDTQTFTLTATGPVGSKVIALTGANLTNPGSPVGGTYSSTALAATNSVAVSISNGQTVRFYINALAAAQTLTITESATTFWEQSAASISCAPYTGTPTLTTNNATRTMTAALSTTNSAATCTITNKKRSKITVVKNVDGRVLGTDQFRVRSTTTDTYITNSAGTQIFSPIDVDTVGGDTTKQTVFWATPGQTITITDSTTSGSLADYYTIYSCSNALVGSPTTMPSGTTSSFTLTPTDGDDITCTYTNRVKPRVTKAFSPTSVGTNDPSVLTITLENKNTTVAITGVAFTDTYPGGLVNTGTPSGATTCTGGTVTAGAGLGSVALSSATIPANSTCTVTVNVTSATASSYLNTIAAGDVTSTNASSNPSAATDTLTVLNHPTATKSFSPAELAVSTASTLTITLSNSNAVNITGAGFTDNFPANVTVASPVVTSNTCGGTYTNGAGGAITAGDTSIKLVGGTIPPAGCSLTVKVTSTLANSYTNTIASGNITSTNAGNTTAATSGTVKFLDAPTVTKAFSPTSIGTNDTSVLTITLTNPNSFADITGAAFTDTYPANVVNTGSPNGSTTCGGTPTVTAAAGGGSVALSGATIPASGSCTVTVNVTSGTVGTYNNSTGAVSTTNAGTGTAASATLTVLTHPTVTKSFGTTDLPVNTNSTLTITINNPNTVAITSVSFTDTYPANVVNASPTGLSTTNCGVAASATAGGNTVSLTNGSIAAGATCTITVDVTSNTRGTYNNSTGTITTANAGNGTAATATVKFYDPPTVTKSFTANSILANTASVLTITLSNPNALAITGAAFTDTYPANLVNTGTPAGATTCAGGTVTAAAGGGSVALSGATIPANGSCTVTVNVTSATAGTYNNSIAAGGVTTTYAGSNASAATASLYVYQLPSLVVLKSVSTYSDPVNGTGADRKAIPGALMHYDIVVTNTGLGTANTVFITDAIPTTDSEFYADDLGGAGSGPLLFTDGATASGLTYTFASLSSLVDNIAFSNDNGTTWTYTPVPVGGYDPNVTNIKVTLSGTFNASDGINNPSFTLKFRVRIK